VCDGRTQKNEQKRHLQSVNNQEHEELRSSTDIVIIITIEKKMYYVHLISRFISLKSVFLYMSWGIFSDSSAHKVLQQNSRCPAFRVSYSAHTIISYECAYSVYTVQKQKYCTRTAHSIHTVQEQKYCTNTAHSAHTVVYGIQFRCIKSKRELCDVPFLKIPQNWRPH